MSKTQTAPSRTRDEGSGDEEAGRRGVGGWGLRGGKSSFVDAKEVMTEERRGGGQ